MFLPAKRTGITEYRNKSQNESERTYRQRYRKVTFLHTLHRWNHTSIGVYLSISLYPHPLTQLAAREVQAYLSERKEWEEELHQGKMFGVLVVRTPDNRTGYLAAFSGNLAGSNSHPFFVPPVYDLLQPDGFFRLEEAQISQINTRIRELEQASEYQSQKKSYWTYRKPATGN